MFLCSYNNNVSGASKHIRMGFLRKVYGLLSLQLGMTTLIASACLFTPAIKELVHKNPWLIMVAFILSFGLLIGKVVMKLCAVNLTCFVKICEKDCSTQRITRIRIAKLIFL